MEKILISSEVASWVVNWVNTSFNVSKLISAIRSVVVNGSDYAQYTFSWTTITLDDAPVSGTVIVTYEYEYNLDYLDNSNWITWEILEWDVDSVNRRFTSFYPISFVDEVRVNGVPTVAYTFSWNTILLTSAPTIWVVDIDYFKKDVVAQDYNRDLYYTFWEIRSKIYDKISEDGWDTTRYPLNIVNDGIVDWLDEICSIRLDKSRQVTYSIKASNPIDVVPISNSITTLQLTLNRKIPSKWRLLTSRWDFIDYSTISSLDIASGLSFVNFPTEGDWAYVGYRLPRNCLRVTSVRFNGYEIQELGSLSDIASYNGYIINNWYIYFWVGWDISIEFEPNEYLTRSLNDSTVIFVDRSEVSVIIYYCLRQVYAEREDDRLQTTSELYLDKLKSYKRKIGIKRARLSGNKIKT